MAQAMKGGGSKDQFANKFYGTCTQTAANTLTFTEINTNMSTFDKVAWVLHRLEWWVSEETRNLLLSSDDYIQFALCSSKSISSLELNDSAVIDVIEISANLRTNVGIQFTNDPVIRDFANMPGGGIIISPRPLYVAVQSESIASAAKAQVRGYFTQLPMSADQYLELIDFYRIVQ